jgi:transcriptional regulator with XRE-family HTH domain
MNIDIKRLGAYVAARRKEVNMSQDMLAKRIQSCQSYVSEVEQGKKEPSLAFVGKLAEVLEVPPAWLCQWAYEDPYANEQ